MEESSTKTYIHLSLALACAQVDFRANRMLEAEHQRVVSDLITSFSRALKKPNRGWTFEKSYLHEPPLQEQDFPRNTILFP